MTKRALVFGGTGAIGRSVVADLSDAGIDTVFTYHKSKKLALDLCDENNSTCIELDLTDTNAIRALIHDLDKDDMTPDIFVHCAAVTQNKTLHDITDNDWELLQRVNCQSVLVACQALSHTMATRKSGEIILLGALTPRQSIDLPLHFAATQGMLTSFTTTAAKSLGPLGIRINMVIPGLLEHGISSQFNPRLHENFIQFSALGRKGNTQEISRAIIWLATLNSYVNGQIIPVNGGI